MSASENEKLQKRLTAVSVGRSVDRVWDEMAALFDEQERMIITRMKQEQRSGKSAEEIARSVSALNALDDLRSSAKVKIAKGERAKEELNGKED